MQNQQVQQRWPELGPRQHCRDNVTMFSGLKVVGFCTFTIFVVATPSRHQDLNIFRIFSCPWGSVTLSRYHIVVVAKLKYCRLPSSDNHYIYTFVYSKNQIEKLFFVGQTSSLWQNNIYRCSVLYNVSYEYIIMYINKLIIKLNILVPDPPIAWAENCHNKIKIK